jgi:hypothetical protein
MLHWKSKPTQVIKFGLMVRNLSIIHKDLGSIFCSNCKQQKELIKINLLTVSFILTFLSFKSENLVIFYHVFIIIVEKRKI